MIPKNDRQKIRPTYSPYLFPHDSRLQAWGGASYNQRQFWRESVQKKNNEAIIQNCINTRNTKIPKYLETVPISQNQLVHIVA